MTISEFAKLLRRHWLLIVACAALCVTIAVSAALFFVKPSYSAKVGLYVSAAGATAGERWNNGEYARSHISSYADLVNSNDLLQAVRDSLGNGQGYLADSISASNPLDTLIIDVTVQDSSPEQAQAVAAAIGQVYDSFVARLESPSGRSVSPVRINVVSPPNLPRLADSPNRKLYAAAGLFVGLAVGAAVARLLELRQPRQRRGRVNVRPFRHAGHQGRRNLDDVAMGPETMGSGGTRALQLPPQWPRSARLRQPVGTPDAPDGNGARGNRTEGRGEADL